MLGLMGSAVGLVLESIILFRGFQGRILARFPLFYAYLFCVLLVDAVSRGVYILAPGLYRNWYWGSQFLTLLVGYGVILEIVDKALARYPGASKFARAAVVWLFAAVFSYVLIQSLRSPGWSPAASYGELERDLRGVQVLVLTSILLIISFYRVSLSRNLKGIIGGYGVFLASSVMSLEGRTYVGPAFEASWKVILISAYLVSLMIWTFALWFPSPAAGQSSQSHLDGDYESFAMKTKDLLGLMRAYLGRTVRP